MTATPHAAHAAGPSRVATLPSQRRALRFLTAGSVDDGKSTLIGRLLYDSRAILADQLDALERRSAGAPIDLSLLTDGLEAEREQGITIDVAYRYFATPRRKFIIADAPGHEQYTRNMVTAAAGSDAAVVLVDVTKLDLRSRPVALLPQTRRHALLAHLLRVPGMVFAVNKLDAVDDPAGAYAAVREALLEFAGQARLHVAGIVPVSALRGDNVTSTRDVPWYRGPSLLELLERLPAAEEDGAGPFALPVQYVDRHACANAPRGGGDLRRAFWGRLARGSVQPGDPVQVFPSGETARVEQVRVADVEVACASAGQSAGIVLDRQLDVSRGDWLAASQALPGRTRFDATLAWLDVEPAAVGRKYLLRHGHRWVCGRVAAIRGVLDIQTLQARPGDSLGVNEMGEVVIEAQEPLPIGPYAESRDMGALIVVDPATNRTSGALLVAA